ncbi:MAG: rod shape-determining protein MreD [Acetobacter sp.]|nr:rod shape-determining protein MreD [Acetobacter sp.]
MKNSIKNLCTTLGTYLVPILSIITLELLLYIPRTGGFLNFLRLTPFYAGIYFWQSQRPDAFNMISAFILGIFADVLSSTPLGVNIAAFLFLFLLSGYLSSLFNVKKFSYSWLLFILATFATFLFKALTVSIFYRRLIPLNYLLFEFLLTFTLYPLWARIYIWTERRYIHLEERYEKI